MMSTYTRAVHTCLAQTQRKVDEVQHGYGTPRHSGTQTV